MTAAMKNFPQKCKNRLPVAILTNSTGRKLCHNYLFITEKLPSDGRMLKNKYINNTKNLSLFKLIFTLMLVGTFSVVNITKIRNQPGVFEVH